jgi:hypothetical protein
MGSAMTPGMLLDKYRYTFTDTLLSAYFGESCAITATPKVYLARLTATFGKSEVVS